MARLALAVDLGGTNLRVAVVDDTGVIQDEAQQPTDAAEGPQAIVERIGESVNEMASKAQIPTDVPIGVASPGPLDPRTGIVYFSPNLAGWTNVPISEWLRAKTGRNVLLSNDANAAALGEVFFGAGRGVRNLIYVGLGTGVGGGVYSEGLLIDGARGMGGELGHVTVDLNGPRCTCGSAGCIEAYCSAWALTRDAHELIASGRGAAILKAAGSDADAGPKAIGEAARQGDPAAIALLDRAGRALGAGLANFVNIFNPEIIALGGGVAQIGDLLIDPAKRALDAFSMPIIRDSVRFVPSELGVKTGIYGAAALSFYDARH
ncbi:MAG TPA: transcriptional regulator [Chloroflexi bacterium]|nr:transcriptional regulator [Chloroflexota bacterium]HCG30701.1 transcriptional regulator [Chloroflexota bacterium]